MIPTFGVFQKDNAIMFMKYRVYPKVRTQHRTDTVINTFKHFTFYSYKHQSSKMAFYILLSKKWENT